MEDEEMPVVIVKSAIWKYLKKMGFRMSGDFPKQLNKIVIGILEKAIIVSKINRRKTVLKQDCM